MENVNGELKFENGKTPQDVFRAGAEQEIAQMKSSGEQYQNGQVDATIAAMSENLADAARQLKDNAGQQGSTAVETARASYELASEYLVSQIAVAGETGNIEAAGRLAGLVSTITAEAARVLPANAVPDAQNTSVAAAVDAFNKLIGEASSSQNAAGTGVAGVEAGRLALASGVADAAVTYASINHPAADSFANVIANLYGGNQAVGPVLIAQAALTEAAAEQAAKTALGERALLSNGDFTRVTAANSGVLKALTTEYAIPQNRVTEVTKAMVATNFATAQAGVTLNFAQASQAIKAALTNYEAKLPPSVREAMGKESLNPRLESSVLKRGAPRLAIR
jgi:hypothetical protein